MFLSPVSPFFSHFLKNKIIFQLPISPSPLFSTFPGKIPSAEEGTTRATGCLNRDRECCVLELPILVRNCSSELLPGEPFVVYRLEPPPRCDMGYCAGDGVPCPRGMASVDGYSPCECEYIAVWLIVVHHVKDILINFTCECELIDLFWVKLNFNGSNTFFVQQCYENSKIIDCVNIVQRFFLFLYIHCSTNLF